MRLRFSQLAIIALCAVLILRAIGPVLIRCLVNDFDILSQAFYRYLIAALFWFPWMLVTIRKGEFDNAIWKLAIIPALLNAAVQLCWVSSMYHINAGLAALLIKSQVIWAPLLVVIFLADERILFQSKKFWLGFVISIVGLLGVLGCSGAFSVTATTAGVILVTLAAIGWSGYTVLLRRVFLKHDSRQAFSVIAIYTAITLFVFSVFSGDNLTNVPTTIKPWLMLIVASVLGISLAHVCYIYTLKKLGATIPVVVLLTQPFIVLVFSNIASGEVLSLAQFGFGSILLLGGLLALLGKSNVDKEKTDRV